MVYSRLLQLPRNHSFFLFGPRGTGKSTLVDSWLKELKIPASGSLYLDLLDPDTEERYAMRPALLREELGQSGDIRWCIIDEVQKIPSLLDVAHWAIQKRKCHFALTGSSARKLKRAKGNLLAGRAFDLRLHPLCQREIGSDFRLEDALRYGTLPEVLSLTTERDKVRFLESYARTYLREEIQLEQLVRQVQRFRRFLAFAGQMNTKILSFSKLSAASGVDEKSVNRYFEILEDTLIGVLLEPYDLSVRRRQSRKPKFYLFDTGVACHLREDIRGPLMPGTSAYGELFEQWVILELMRLNEYCETRDQFFYLRTKDDVEIDLIIVRKGQKPILIEIKSGAGIGDSHTTHLANLKREMPHSRAMVICQEPRARHLENGIEILPYARAIDELYPS